MYFNKTVAFEFLITCYN